MEEKGKNVEVTGWEDALMAFGVVVLIGLSLGCVLAVVLLVIGAILRLLGVL